MAQESLNRLLADLHAERLRTWDPAQLKINVDQRRTLVAAVDPAAFPQVGDGVGGFNLEEVDGRTLTLDTLVEDGPAVLIFFRYAGCPACNIALPYYQRALAPALKALGASLTAVSPQIPARLADIKRAARLRFQRRHRPRQCPGPPLRHPVHGRCRQPGERARQRQLHRRRHGTGTWELPMPAVIVIDQEHTVRFVTSAPTGWCGRRPSR